MKLHHPRRIFAVLATLVVLAAFWLHRSQAAFTTPGSLATVATAATPPPSPQAKPDIPTELRNRVIIGATILPPAEDPALAGFDAWAGRYLAATGAARDALLAEGRELAAARRVVLAKMIRTDPRAALAAAVPMVVRQQLPADIVALLEERVSGRGELALNGVTPLPGQPAPDASFRSALVNGQEYRAHVFGRRELPGTVTKTSMNGIALDGHFAVAESPLRVLEAGEIAAGRPINEVCDISGNTTPTAVGAPLNTGGDATAVEYDGSIHILCGANHLAAAQAKLLAREESAMQSAAAGGPGSSDVVGRPLQAWTHGPKKLLVIRVDFSDKPGQPVDNSRNATLTEDYVVNMTTTVQSFYVQNSFGKSSLVFAPAVNGDSPDVTSVFRMPQPATYYDGRLDGVERSGMLHQDARNAAQAAGINLDGYDRIGVVCGTLNFWWAGLGNIGGRNFWINGYYDFRVVSHEIGHTYGLMHANYWQPPEPYTDPISMAGTSIEYGDYMDVMGSGDQPKHHFSHWNKSILQWIPDSNVTTIETSGIYRVHRFDDGAADLNLPRALKLRFDDVRDYWIGFRGGMTEYNAAHGAYVLWGYHNNQQGNLLNLGAPGRTWTYDMPLPVGSSYTDTVSGVTLRTLAEGGTGADRWLDMEVTFLSALQWSQIADYVAGEQDGTVTLTVVRKGDASAAASVEYTTLSGDPNNAGAVAGSDFVAQSGVLSWPAGDASSRTITLSLISDAIAEGGERFTVRLGNATGGLVTRNASATVNVIDRDVRDFGYQPDEVTAWVRKALVLPDGSQVLGGSFQYIRDSEGTLHTVGRLAKLTVEGRLVPEFTAGVAGLDNIVYDLGLQPDGKIVVAGSFNFAGGANHANLARFLPDGSLDATFTAAANSVVRTLKVQADGKILIGGSFTQVNGLPRAYVARLNADGSLDSTFNGPAFSTGSGWSVSTLALQADGRVLAGGLFAHTQDGNTHTGILRMLPNGNLDNSFTTGTGARDNVTIRSVRAIALLPDGRMMVGGEFTTFNGQPHGRLARLAANGAVDVSFTAGLDGPCTAFLPLPDGRVVIGGVFRSFNGVADNSIAILQPNDSVNTYFASTGGFDGGEVSDIILLPNGRIQFCGSYQPFQYATPWSPIWRFMSGLEHPPGTVQLTASSAAGNEGETLSFTATRSGGTGPISVSYVAAPGTAAADDFLPASGVLTWADGDTSARTITVGLRTDALAEVDETFLVNLGAPLQGGVLLGARQQAVVTIRSTGQPPPPPNDWQSVDIGAVGVAGSSSENGGVVTVSGAGADIWGAADAFHFRAQALTGDGAIVVRVASMGNTHQWAKVGLMFREDLTPGSREVMAFVSPGNHSGLQYRLEPGAQSAMGADLWSGLPVWLMLVRSGDTFGGYRSYDGVNWTPLGSINCNLPDTAYVGLAVSSHASGLLLSANFDNLDVTGTTQPPDDDPPPAPPDHLTTTGATASTVTLTWRDNSSDETGFAIERAPGFSESFVEVGTASANSQAFTDTGLSANTTYAYRVRAFRGSVYSGYSEGTLITTNNQPPSSWQGLDIGNTGPGGSETIVEPNITVRAGGADIWGTADGFRFVYKAWTGDGEIRARVASLGNTHPWAKAGVMFRESLAAGSRHVAYVLTADNTSGLAARAATGGDTSFSAGPWFNAPFWVRLVRSGDTFTAFISPDGITWTQQGTQTVAMGASIYVGVAVSAHTTTTATTAVFENVQLRDGPPPPPPPPPPSDWAFASLGTGSGSATTPSANAVTLSGTGADIWNQADSGLFAYRDWSGDGSVTARVDSLTNTHPWAKAGIMMRENVTDSGARNVFLGLTPGVGAVFQIRAADGGVTEQVSQNWGPGVPCWLRLTRTGENFVADFSSDGATWTRLAAVDVPQANFRHVGLAASSHSASPGTAVFTNISMPADQPPPPPPPPPGTWTQTTLGNGSGSFTNPDATHLTVSSVGADLWGQFDDGLFIQREWTGDGRITVRLDSLTNTHPWAKAGVMFRENLTATSPNLFVGLTPTNGATFQVRATSSGTTSEAAHSWLPGAPCWVRLTRAGNTFTAEFSMSGDTWVSLGVQTVPMAGTIRAGIAVSSHTSGPISAAFSGVQVQ